MEMYDKREGRVSEDTPGPLGEGLYGLGVIQRRDLSDKENLRYYFLTFHINKEKNSKKV